jgi:putative transposase
MPRKQFTPTTEFPYHITNRCNNREWFDVPLPIVWSIFCDQISDSVDRFSVQIHSFVLMSNHFHMMLRTPLGNLDRFLRHFLTETARGLKRESKRINHIFGGRTRQTILDSACSVAYVYKYIYRNPVRAGISSRVEAYPYSSLSRIIESRCDIPVVDGIESDWSLIPRPQEARLTWLNLPTPKEQELLISRGLRGSRFRFSRSNSIRKELERLFQSYGIQHSYDPYHLGPEGE